MGYSTEFKGELRFTKELTAKQLAKIKTFLGEDCREHPEWGNVGLSYIDLELTDDFDGLKWNGSEKTYDLVEKVNLLIDNVKKKYPDFGLSGNLVAQGEDLEDRWVLSIENGKAVERKTAIKGRKVTCPHCDEEFLLEDSNENNSEDGGNNGNGFIFVFTGFRNNDLKNELEEIGHSVEDSVSKRTTHLVVNDVSKISSKRTRAEELGCEIWTIKQTSQLIETHQ